MKLRDVEIAESIMDIVEEEVNKIKENPDRETGDMIILEKVSKIYSVIMASNRELLKSGALGKLSSQELDKNLNDSGDDEDDAE
jgi:hypothetical protein